MAKKKESRGTFSEKTDALFQKIGELTKVQRLLICVGTFVLIGVGFYFLLIGPQFNTLKSSEETLNNERRTLATYKSKALTLPKEEARMAEVQEQFNIAMTALPDKRELPSLLDEISKAGKSAGLEVQLFQPENTVDSQFYKEIPLSMTVRGGYHQMADFFYQVAGLNRIVTIPSISMDRVKPEKDSTARNVIQMKCRAVTYMFVEPKEEDATKANKGRKKS